MDDRPLPPDSRDADRASGRGDLVTAAMPHGPGPSAVVLVEGASDRIALETLAARRGRDLAADRVAIVAMGGASSVGHFLAGLGPRGRDVTLAGLCDEAEVGVFLRGLRRSGIDPDATRASMGAHGFHVCTEDLEDELVRALGMSRVEAVLAAGGGLHSWRTFQQQPAQRGRPDDVRVRRVLGAGSGRKLTYARLLVEALELSAVPAPLDAVLDAV